MRAHLFITLVAGAGVLARAAPVAAQLSLAWTDRARVGVNGGLQQASASFDTSATKAIYLENAIFKTTYKVSSGPIFDGGVAVRVFGSFGVGVAVTSFSQTKDASVAGTVPHPFFYNTPRSISGTAPGLKRSEVATHIQGVYVVSGKKIDLALAAGPTWFNLKQDLVTDAIYAESYPYDVATFSSTNFTQVSKSRLGFNVGADIGVRFHRNVGVGGIVRFSRASVDLAAANGVAVTVDAGGLQAGGGLRLFF